MPELRNNTYTNSIIELTDAIAGKDQDSGSLFNDARIFFESYEQDNAKRQTYKKQIEELKTRMTEAGSQKELTHQCDALSHKLEKLDAKLNQQRQQRLGKVKETCLNILALSEGRDQDETWYRSAKFMGTILLLSPGNGNKLASYHQRLKPAYKVVCSLRFLDQLLDAGDLKNAYFLNHYNQETRFDNTEFQSNPFLQQVVLPVMLCAMFQDVGMRHPKTMTLLKGDSDDEFRVLDAEDRKTMLRLNFEYTQLYLDEGLGGFNYEGDSLDQEKQFDQIESERLIFQTSLLKQTTIAKQSIGEILKIPQIYTSVVLSTKRNFKRADLPNAAVLIEQMALKGIVTKKSARLFVKLVGYFPVGYGVCYLTEDHLGSKTFEFAIVTGLRPNDKQDANCRSMSKKQIFTTSGKNVTVTKENNLHFADVRKLLKPISKERLIEIMQVLSYDFDATKLEEEGVIPSMWDAHDVFINRSMQNIWAKAE